MNPFRKFRRNESQAQALIEKAVVQAETGRRLAIFDRASGLFASRVLDAFVPFQFADAALSCSFPLNSA